MAKQPICLRGAVAAYSTGHIWNGIRLVGQPEEVLVKFRQIHPPIDWSGVPDDVQIVELKIDDAAAG